MARRRVRRAPRAETREQVLDAAARVFAKRGFHAATVEAVSEEAGFSTGAIYSNFEGKEDLFLTLYEERIQRRRRELREVIAQAGGAAEGLAPAAANAAQTVTAERDWFLLYFEFVLHAARNRSFAKRFEVVREEGLDELAGGIGEGLAHAGLDSSLEPQQLARALRALSYGLALDGLVEEVPDALLGKVLQLIFAGLRAEAEAGGK